MVDYTGKYHAKGLEQLGYEFEKDFTTTANDDGSVTLVWKSSDPQPTIEECTTALNTYNANQYQRTRAAAYPSFGDQLDMLWHAVDTGDWTAAKVKTTEFYTALKAVKDANPKP